MKQALKFLRQKWKLQCEASHWFSRHLMISLICVSPPGGANTAAVFLLLILLWSSSTVGGSSTSGPVLPVGLLVLLVLVRVVRAWAANVSVDDLVH